MDSIKYCHLTGVFDSADRRFIRSEFEKFGKIKKIFTCTEFAKVYFEKHRCCERAVESLRNNNFGWILEIREEEPASNYISKKQASSTPRPKPNMDDYLDQDFVENNEYCDIHGNLLTTFKGEYTNDIFVKLSDIRHAGFTIFRRDTFDRLIVDKNQIFKEFELHLLSESKNYILKNRVCEIDEEQILKTIESCKVKLLGNQHLPNEAHNTSAGQKVTNSSNNNISIVSPISQCVPKRDESFVSSVSGSGQRVPKTLPSNFKPSERNNGQNTFQASQDDKRNTNGFGSDRSNSSKHERSYKSDSPNQNRSQGDASHFRNRTCDESSSSDHSSRKGINTINNRNPNVGNNTENNTQLSKPHFNRRHERYSSEHQEKLNDVQGRKQRMEFEVNEQLEKIMYQDGETYEVQVCYLETEHKKNNICWVHKKEMNKALEDIILKLLDIGPQCEMITDLRTGQICIAPYEEAWYRCKVIKKEPLYVQFLDYGNKSLVDCVRVLPDEFKTIPALATRLVFSKEEENVDLRDEMNLSVRIKQKYDDGTHVVETDKRSSEPTKLQSLQHPKVTNTPEKGTPRAEEPSIKKSLLEKQYFDVPGPLCTLKNGDTIMICGMLDSKFTVKTRESATKTKELFDYIKSLDKTTLTLADVKKGQLVLCSIDGLPNLCRAVVTEAPSGGTVCVRYLDYAGENRLTVKSLRNVDDHLAAHPTCLLMTPECHLLEDLTEETEGLISELIGKKMKGKLVLRKDDFDIELDGGSFLLQDICSKSSKLQEEVVPTKLEQTKTNKISTTGVDESPVTYDDMDWMKAEVGTTDQFICYNIKDLENITLISLTDESLKYLEAVTDMVIEDDTPYEPDVFEMCMVSYKAQEDPEAAWYRAAVLEKEGDKITVNSVDYGSNIVVTKKDIRKFDKKYKDIPILGIACEFVDIPDNKKVLDTIKEMVPEGEQLTVVLKDFDGLKYKVHVPEINNKLKKLGLL